MSEETIEYGIMVPAVMDPSNGLKRPILSFKENDLAPHRSYLRWLYRQQLDDMQKRYSEK